MQRQKAASAYFTSKQISPLVLAEQCELCTSKYVNIYMYKEMNNIVVEQYMLHCIGEILNIIYLYIIVLYSIDSIEVRVVFAGTYGTTRTPWPTRIAGEFTLTRLNFFCIKHGDQSGVFSI